MDPTGLTNAEWSDIGKLLRYTWIMAGLVVSAGVSMTIGHIFIPSLVATFHLPQILQKTRPVFYAMAVALFGFAVFFLILAIDLSDVLSRFWDDYWI